MPYLPPEMALHVARYVWADKDDEMAVLTYVRICDADVKVYDTATDSFRVWSRAEKPYYVLEHVVYGVHANIRVEDGCVWHVDAFSYTVRSCRVRTVDETEMSRLVANGVKMYAGGYVDPCTGLMVRGERPD
jgi:meiotically up-regulated gene 157 (Mug157) protein